MSTLIKQSSSGTPLRFLLVSSTDHITGLTGLGSAVTVTISKNGATFAAPSGAISEIGNGWYKVAGNATDTNTLGPIDLHASGTGSDPTDMKDCALVVAFDPTDAAISSRSTYAGADTSGTTILLGRITGAVPLASDYTSARATKLDNLDAAISTRSTYAGADTSGTSTLLARLTAIRAGLLDNLDATVSSRSTYAGGDTSGTATLLARLTATRAGLLDNMDAAISSRSTYAGGDTSGTTTLLGRLSAIRAALLDNLDATISSRLAAAGYTAPDNTSIAAIKTQTDKLVFTNVGKLDVQVRGMDTDVVNAAALAADAGAEIVGALKAAAFDGAFTFQQIVQVIAGALAGKLSGAGTATVTIRDISDTKNLIVATVGATGRTAVTLNV